MYLRQEHHLYMILFKSLPEKSQQEDASSHRTIVSMIGFVAPTIFPFQLVFSRPYVLLNSSAWCFSNSNPVRAHGTNALATVANGTGKGKRAVSG